MINVGACLRCRLLRLALHANPGSDRPHRESKRWRLSKRTHRMNHRELNKVQSMLYMQMHMMQQLAVADGVKSGARRCCFNENMLRLGF